MRGSPLFRSVCAAVVLMVAGLPIWRLTHREVKVARDDAGDALTGTSGAAAISVQLRIEFTSAPRALRLLHIDRALCAVENPPVALERTLSIPWPPEGVDLRVQIGWPEGASLAAARVSLITPDGVEHQRSIWGAGPTDEVLTFP